MSQGEMINLQFRLPITKVQLQINPIKVRPQKIIKMEIKQKINHSSTLILLDFWNKKTKQATIKIENQ
jgi:hypothetical protein